MGKRLAIKGHFTRGWEVIELLEMLGGVNGKINKRTGKAYNIYIMVGILYLKYAM